MTTTPRETSAQQIGLVDACLEESAYDAALSLLNQARSDAVRPSNDHIRVLVYLALHPPLHGKRKLTKGKPSEAAKKPVARRGRRPAAADDDDLGEMQTPTQAECNAALSLLVKFTDTLHPAYILCALPAHLAMPHASPPPEMIDSIIMKRASVLARKRDCSDCWAMLREGFVSGSGTIEPASLDGEQEVAPVGKNAWRILLWLVGAFERDAQYRKEEQESPLKVPLFLTQLPQDRLNGNRGGPLTNCRTPVEIASFCLTAGDDLSPALNRRRRQELGVRLFRIMYDLSVGQSGSSPALDPVTFVRYSAMQLRGVDMSSLNAFCRAIPDHLSIAVLGLNIAHAARHSTRDLFAGEGQIPIASSYTRPRPEHLRPLLIAPLPPNTSQEAAERHLQSKALLWFALVRTLEGNDATVWRRAAKDGSLQELANQSFKLELFGGNEDVMTQMAATCRDGVVARLDALKCKE